MTAGLYYTVLVLGLAFFLGLELRRPGFRRASVGWHRPRVRRNWSFLVGALASGALLQLASAHVGKVVPALLDAPRFWALDIAGCFVVAELVGWVSHYLKHKSEVLWAFHFQHHRETRYDIWLITHTHGMEVVVSGLTLTAVLALLGFGPVALQTYFLFYTLSNLYKHSSYDLTLGWLDTIIVSPAYHRHHHAVGAQLNYANTLTIWDVFFRTVRWPESWRRPELLLGTGNGPEPYGFLREMFYFRQVLGNRPRTNP